MSAPDDQFLLHQEAAVVGASLADKGATLSKLGLHPELFVEPTHRAIVAQIVGHVAAGSTGPVALPGVPVEVLDALAARAARPDELPALAAAILARWQRRQLLMMVDELTAVATESSQHARGLTSRADAATQIAELAGHLSHFIASAQMLLHPLPILLTGDPGGLSRLVHLVPYELRILAAAHLTQAAVFVDPAADGAVRLRGRAEQLLGAAEGLPL